MRVTLCSFRLVLFYKNGMKSKIPYSKEIQYISATSTLDQAVVLVLNVRLPVEALMTTCKFISWMEVI